MKGNELARPLSMAVALVSTVLAELDRSEGKPCHTCNRPRFANSADYRIGQILVAVQTKLERCMRELRERDDEMAAKGTRSISAKDDA